MALTLHGTVSDNTVALDRKTATPLIINGDMQIAQRSTSATGKTGIGYHSLDRFLSVITSMGTWTQSQSTDVPTGQGFLSSLKMDCTTAKTSPDSNSALILIQRIEGQNLQMLKYGASSAETITLSFWVKSAKTGTYIIELDQHGNSKDYSQSYTINSANTWEKKVMTFSGDTASSLANDNTQQLEINFWLGAGSDYSSGTLNTSWASTTNANRAVGQVNLADSTSNDWYITGVQLEVGTFDANSIPPFQFEDRGTSLLRCQRYYQKSYDLEDEVGNTSESDGYNVYQIDDGALQRDGVRFMTRMRSNPSVTIYNPSTGATASARTNAGNNYSASTYSKGECGFFVDYTPSSGQFVFFHYTADSEL